jgi:hypothetical protein
VKKADAATSITTSETGITNSGTNVPYGQTAAVFGFSIVTNTTTADLSTVSFTTANGYLNDLPAAGIRLVSSSTANYTTSTTLATVPATLVTTGTTLTFTITTPTGQVISTAPTKYYFLVVTFNGTAVLTLPDNFTFTLSTVTSITPTLTTNPNRAGTQYNFVAATLTQAQTTGGLPPGTTITGIQTNVALLGLSLTSTGTSSFSTLTFATTQNISTYFTTGNVNLYSSTSNIFSIGTATKLASTPVTATKVITFTGLAQTITNGATMYYYIVMDNYSPPAVSATFAVNLTTITPPNNNTVVTYGDQTGTVYTLSPISITEAQITAGLASTTQTASQNNLGVFGMSLTANGNTSFTGLKFGTTSTLPAGSNISTYFSSALIYTSSSSTFDGTATAVAGATYTTLAATTLTVTLPTQTINDGAANAKYYYLVVNYTQPLTSATYQFTLTNITGGPATTTIGSGAGQVYNLNAPTITENQTPGGGLYAPTNIIGNQTNLALSGISLVSANGNSTATVINYTATQNISTYFTGNVNF